MATDSFTNTNGTVLSTHDANWANVTGQAIIQSNAMTGNTNAASSMYRWTGETWTDHQSSEGPCNIAAGGGTVGVAVRVQSGSFSGYAAEVGVAASPTVYISRYDSGTYNNLQSNTETFVNGDNLYMEHDASDNITVKINTTTIYGPTTDATYGSGDVGVSAYDDNQNTFLLSWIGTSLGAAGAGNPWYYYANH